MKNRARNLLTDRSYRKLLDSLYEGVYLVDSERTIVYWNDADEQMTGYKSGEVVGKHCWDGLLMHVDSRGTSLCTNRCLLHEAMELKKSVEGKVFFHHRDGHEVPVTVRTTPILGDRGRVLGAAQIFSDNSSTEDLGRKVRELERMALLDPLTKLGNRRYGQMNLSGKLREFKRYGWPFGVLFIDIDKFKAVNDTYGHDAGDRVLRLVAATIRNGLRSSDVVVRWGGEEFVAIVASVDEEKLRHVGEKLRVLVERSSISLEKETKSITISIGATLARKRDSSASLIKRADTLMYQSKKEGRNRLSI
jgi:diguanylate cyclase (GGDEF)-like protein/PAS domain S-box-containing protein